jgi:thiol-disulfide isomerase/thioredoxin
MNYQFHWVSLVVLLLGLGWIVATRQSATATIVVAPGFPLPTLTFQTAIGSDVTTVPQGRAQVLTLWASWCPPCRAEIPVVAALAPSLVARGIDVVLVNQGESPADAQGVLTDQHITLPVWYDRQGALATAVASRDLPTTVFVDARGVVRLVYRGPVSPDVLTNMANILTIGGQP